MELSHAEQLQDFGDALDNLRLRHLLDAQAIRDVIPHAFQSPLLRHWRAEHSQLLSCAARIPSDGAAATW